VKDKRDHGRQEEEDEGITGKRQRMAREVYHSDRNQSDV